MIRTTIAATIALAAAALAPTAQAKPPRAVAASWHPDMGAKGRYCVRTTHLETAAMTGTRIYQRTCRSERSWQEMGVTFTRRTPGRQAMAAR